MWAVFLFPDVEKFLKKQDKFIKELLLKGFEKLKTENPFVHLQHYEDKKYYKFRIGNYRALIDADFDKKILDVRVLDHRSVIYKRKH